MLGRKTSLIELKKYLIDEKKILNISEAQFCQGGQFFFQINICKFILLTNKDY